jgi:hypothetical protein
MKHHRVAVEGTEEYTSAGAAIAGLLAITSRGITAKPVTQNPTGSEPEPHVFGYRRRGDTSCMRSG